MVVVVAVIDANTPFREIGDCPLQAWRDEARRLGSPMAEADLWAAADAASPHGALALAQGVKETQLGKTAPARNNFLGLMADGKFVAYASWGDCAREFQRRLSDLAYKGGVYAPHDMPLLAYVVTYVGGPGCWTSGGATCANGETWDGQEGGSIGLYLRQTVARLNAYLADDDEEVRPVEPSRKNPFRAPTIYGLDKDFGRFGLSKRQADKILGHRFVNRNGQKIAAIVLHIQEGTTPGSLSWWASGNADASSSVMVQKDGSLLRVIEDRHGPYTNGDISQPTAKGRALLNATGWVNPNLVSVTVEAEGYSGDQPTEAMVETVCWMATEWMTRHGLGIDDVYRHADINSVSRAFCPGRYFDLVISRLRNAPTGDDTTPKPPGPSVPTWPGKPAWLPEELIPLLFPEASPTGVRTRAWLSHCGAVGRAPARKAFLFHGTERELIQFEDGLLIDLAGNRLGDPR